MKKIKILQFEKRKNTGVFYGTNVVGDWEYPYKDGKTSKEISKHRQGETFMRSPLLYVTSLF